MSETDIERRLSAARTRLIIDHPFLGALALRMPLVEATGDWCPTTATDARSFYYNPDYLAELSISQLQFVISHETLHCAFSHFSRRQHRIRHRWDLACDFAINPLLVDEGMSPTADALNLDNFRGMTAEEIYPCLDDFEDQKTQDRHLYDEVGEEGDQGAGGEQEQQCGNGGEGDEKPDQQGSGNLPEPLSAHERGALAAEWQQRLISAALTTRQAGALSGELARLVDSLIQPQLPWRMLLARYMSQKARDNYSYQRPSRREGEAIFPTLASKQLEVIIIIDTSGSITDSEVSQFMAEVDAIKGQLRARITLQGCDTRLCSAGPWFFEPWELFAAPDEMGGGGGTSFLAPFDWVETAALRPDVLIYFTDAEGRFPESPPGFPVIWLVKGKEEVPWGQRIQLN